MKSIKDVDFGELDAEADKNLGEYFVDTGVLDRLRAGQRYVVVGRKGAGKTVLFKRASTAELGQDVVPLDYGDYPWAAHRSIRLEGMGLENAYTASWKLSLLLSILKRWKLAAANDLAARASDYITQLFGKEDPGFLEFLFDKVKRVRRLDLPAAAGLTLGGFELDSQMDPGPVLAQSASYWCRSVQQFVQENYYQHPVTIVLDRLDDGWDASEDAKLMLVGVLKACRELNQSFGIARRSPPVIVFLRNDIFDELQFNDKNKLQNRIEFLDWDETSLASIAFARIRRSLGDDVRGREWDAVFTTAKMRQGASSLTYVVRRCMGRPRDIVAYCVKCQEIAVKNKHEKVESVDIYDAEELYSRHIYDELDDEMHKQLPEARTYLQVLRDLRKMSFTVNEWVEACRRRFTATDEPTARSYLRVLFDYSIVGVQRRGGAGGGTKWLFRYNDRFLEPNFDVDVTVHLSMKKHLKLTEVTGGAAKKAKPDELEVDPDTET